MGAYTAGLQGSAVLLASKRQVPCAPRPSSKRCTRSMLTGKAYGSFSLHGKGRSPSVFLIMAVRVPSLCSTAFGLVRGLHAKLSGATICWVCLLHHPHSMCSAACIVDKAVLNKQSGMHLRRHPSLVNADGRACIRTRWLDAFHGWRCYTS